MPQLESPKPAAVTTAAARRAPDDLFSTQQVAQELGISPRTLEGWRATGDGPLFIRCGGRRVLYRWGDVLEWLQTRRFTSTSEEAA